MPIVGSRSSQQPWVPSIKLRRDANSSLDRNELTFRTVRSILNKLTPENFSKLSVNLLNVGISSKVILKGIVILIFDKSIDEPRYSALYANLCYRLYHEAPNFDPPPSQPLKAPHGSTLRPNTFRRLLIAKLQDEFENRNRKLEAFDSKIGPLDADEEEQRILSKHHMLGNIKFIGELYRLGILHESIMHKCVKQLINKKKKGTIVDMAEDLECLSQIMTTCGRRLDHPKAKSLMDQYFERMEVLRKKHPDLPSRIRFMLQDVIELRRNNWVPRRAQRDNGPKTLKQIRHEVEEMYPANNYNGDSHASHHDMNPGFLSKPRNADYLTKKYQADSLCMPTSHYPGSILETSPPPPIHGGMTKKKEESSQGFDFFDPIHPRTKPPTSGVSKTVPSSKPVSNEVSPSRNLQNGYPHPHRAGIEEASKPGIRIFSTNDKNKLNSGSYAVDSLPKDDPSSARKRISPVFSPISRDPPPSQGPHPTTNSRTTSNKVTLTPSSVLGPAKKKTGPSRPHPIDDVTTPQWGRVQPNRRPSPTIHQTNVDAIQAPFQQAIDHANNKNGFVKKSPTIGHPDKNKNNKKTTLSKSDAEKISEELIEEFFAQKRSPEDAGKYVLDLKMQRKHMQILLSSSLVSSLTKSDEDKSRMCSFLVHLLEIKACKKDDIVEGTHTMIGKIAEKEVEIPGIRTSAASLIALLIIDNLVTLAEVAESLAGGIHFPLFLLILKQVSKFKGQDALMGIFTKSEVDMIKMLPEASQNKLAMISILEGKQLQFLFPLVHIESKLANHITRNANPTAIYKWIKDNVTSDLHTEPEFINVLVSCCLDYVTKNSSLANDVDLTSNLSKEIKEKERLLLTEIKSVLRRFLDENQKLQLHALYATQVFCHNKNFPKGLLLRLFNGMYEEDIVDEETFFVWKEDVNDSYLGKGKALFQVNTWLQWLHEAETEDEDDE